MPRKTASKKGKQLPKAKTEWEWLKRYRVWNANRKIFLYPENWIEPELRLPRASRVALEKAVAFVCARCDVGTKREPMDQWAHRESACVLLTGKNQTGALIAAQTLARDLGRDLYHVDLGQVVSKYIGETEKNLTRVFDAAERDNAILFFHEADALFGKRSEVKDSHDRYANIQINYLLQRIENHAGITILAAKGRSNIDPAFLRRLRYVVPIPPRSNTRRGKSKTSSA